MEIKKPQIVTCSEKSGSEVNKTLLFKSVLNDLNLDLWISVYEGNTFALSRQYNMAIAQALEDDVDCLILVHDDVILEEDPIPKLEKLFDTYDVVGVAGTSKIELKSPALWHIMGGGFQGGNLHGCVQHLHKEIIGYMPLLEKESRPPSNFGPYPHRAVMIDGVFMALNRKAMETVRFDEDNPCKFHFYDLNYSLDAHLAGLKVGVGDVLITHASPGLREFTEDWRTGEKYLILKYS